MVFCNIGEQWAMLVLPLLLADEKTESVEDMLSEGEGNAEESCKMELGR